MLLFENFVKENKSDFTYKVSFICSKLGINPNWLMAIMFHESGLNHRIVNSVGATGLIQFMPSTMKSLNTNSVALKSMSNVQQLDYVYSYFKPYSGKMKNIFDVFMVTFFPLAIGKPDTWVFETSRLSRSIIAQQNSAFDLNKDGKITIGEWKQYLLKWFNRQKVDTSLIEKAENIGTKVITFSALFFCADIFMKTI